MIDAHFDDEEKFEELTNMVNDNTSSGVINEFSPFDGFKESLEYANIRISELESKNSELVSENSELASENSRISKLESVNSNLAIVNSELSIVNAELRAEIEELRNQISGK